MTLTSRLLLKACGDSRIGSFIGIWKLLVPTNSGSDACAITKFELSQLPPLGLRQMLSGPMKSPSEPRSLPTAPSPKLTRNNRFALSPVCGPGSRLRRMVPPRLAEPFCTNRPNGPIIAWKSRFWPAALAVRSRCVASLPDPVLMKKLCVVPVSAEPSPARSATFPSELSNVIVYVEVVPSNVTPTLPLSPPSASSAVWTSLADALKASALVVSVVVTVEVVGAVPADDDEPLSANVVPVEVKKTVSLPADVPR